MAKQYSGFKNLTPPIVEPAENIAFEEIVTEERPQENVIQNVEAVVEEISHKFSYRLVVKMPFWQYKKGSSINKDEDIQAVIDAEKMIHCLRIKRS